MLYHTKLMCSYVDCKCAAMLGKGLPPLGVYVDCICADTLGKKTALWAFVTGTHWDVVNC